LGTALAADLKVSPGSMLQLLFAEEDTPQSHRIIFDSYDLLLSATFKTGIDEFDRTVVFCSLDLLEKLLPDIGIEEIHIKLHPHVHEQEIIALLKERLSLDVYSWKDLYPALVAALKLDKYAAFFILSLITLVATMNVISLLFMYITQKRSDIAILKAMGATQHIINKIFFSLGLFITTTACFCGLTCATITCFFLEKYPFIELPDVYYTSHLPAKMEWSFLIVIFCIVIILSFFALFIPIRKTQRITIAQILRFEG
jgi:lipoprotein-releasing system permease protein